MGEGTGILDGIRVVDLATIVFVPSAAAVMSDFGAEVIKVEAPGRGDLYRDFHHLPGMPDSEIDYCWLLDGRNKKSIVVNLKEEAGQRIVHRLLETADVLLTNYHASVLEDLRMSYEVVREVNPRLVFAHGTGFGTEGPEAEKPGYDMVTYWSRSGLEGNMFPLEGYLGPIPCGSGDHPAGMSLFGATMMALFQRERTGQGTYVTTSLLANGAWANSCIIQAQLCGAEFHPRRRREDAINFTNLYYRPKDGKIFKLCIVDAEKNWAPFCRAIARPELIGDPRFATLEERLKHMKELIRTIDDALAEHDLEHWKKALDEAEVPYSVIATYPEIVADAQMESNQVFVELDHPRFGPLKTVNSPIFVDGKEKAKPQVAPGLGEHTAEVLQELGYAAGEIEGFLGAGVVQGADPRDSSG